MTNSHEDYMLRLEVERRTREWGAKFQAMTAELHAKDEQIELARNRRKLQAYISRRIAEEADQIAPELVGYISGDTREEVEQAISTAKAKTSSILDGIRQALPGAPVQAEFPAQQEQPQGLSAEQQTAMTPYTLAQLTAMEPGSPEHLAARAAFGLNRSRGRGLYG